MRLEAKTSIFICFLLILNKDNLSNQTTSRSGKGKISQDLAKFKEQVLKEMEEHNKAKVEQVCVCIHSNREQRRSAKMPSMTVKNPSDNSMTKLRRKKKSINN